MTTRTRYFVIASLLVLGVGRLQQRRAQGRRQRQRDEHREQHRGDDRERELAVDRADRAADAHVRDAGCQSERAAADRDSDD